ncbi:MAG: hypothetical protein AB7G37_05060 [Solirubrobacteraceae bacterium]
MAVLTGKESLRASEIRDPVAVYLGDPVAWSTIKNNLREGSLGEEPVFEKVGRGRSRVRGIEAGTQALDRWRS